MSPSKIHGRGLAHTSYIELLQSMPAAIAAIQPGHYIELLLPTIDPSPTSLTGAGVGKVYIEMLTDYHPNDDAYIGQVYMEVLVSDVITYDEGGTGTQTMSFAYIT